MKGAREKEMLRKVKFIVAKNELNGKKLRDEEALRSLPPYLVLCLKGLGSDR